MKNDGMYMPASNTLFCICYKCGTTSLYQYLFGAFHQEAWCDYAHEVLGVDGPDLSCPKDSHGAMLAAMPPVDAGGEQMGLLTPRTFTANDGAGPVWTADLPGAEAEGMLLESLEGIGAIEREPEDEATSHQQHIVDTYNGKLDQSESVHAKWWGNTFKSGPFPTSMWHDDKIYTHAIVREPVERLISAYVNKLSCGLYSVPVGQRGDGQGDQAQWSKVVEAGGPTRYGQGILEAAKLGRGLETLSYESPCYPGGWGGTKKQERACNPATNFTAASCQGVSMETFADAIVKIYRRWHEDETWLDGNRDHLDVDVTKLNGHFRPQTGAKSCFQSVAPQDYDRVSTVSDAKAMRGFSMHLATTKHGLWSNGHTNSASSGNLYFEGKPWQVPATVIHKLSEATKVERDLLQKYL
jgi:hypothetical protein